MKSCSLGYENLLLLEKPPASVDGQEVMIRFRGIAAQQALLRRDQLLQLQKDWFGPKGRFAVFFSQISRMGRQAPLLDDVLSLTDKSRIKQADQALGFVLGKANRRRPTVNPFKGGSRLYLCCVIFDPSTTFTLCERYAANEALLERDSHFFSKLIGTTRSDVERRIAFLGLIEHFDQLLPVEKCLYSDGYREVHQAHLDREEALYGQLKLEAPISVLLTRMSVAQLLNQIRRPVLARPNR
jgi:hypothetical protein